MLTLIVVVALWSWLFGSLADLAGVEGDGPWAVFYVANWHFIAQSGGYWESFTEPSMFDHLWSLAIEEQFYLVWPLVVVAIWRWSRRPVRTLVVGSGVAIGLSFVAMVLLYDGVEPTRVYMGTDTRAASLLVGALAATEPVRRVARRVVSALGNRVGVVVVLLAALVGWSWVAIDGASSGMLYRGGLLAHSLACAVVISLVVAADRGWFVRGLGWRPLAWIGVLSYGLYLWHWPIYVVLSPDRTGLDGVPLLGVRIAVSVMFAYASFRLVEDPVRHRAAWARGRSGVVVLVAAVVGVMALIVALPDPTGQVARVRPLRHRRRRAVDRPVDGAGDERPGRGIDSNGRTHRRIRGTRPRHPRPRPPRNRLAPCRPALLRRRRPLLCRAGRSPPSCGRAIRCRSTSLRRSPRR